MHILSVTETITDDCEFEPRSVLHVIREMEKILSRLTDALTTFADEVNSLPARIAASEQAKDAQLAQAQADLATAQQENNAAADQIAALQSQLAAIDPAPAPEAPPADQPTADAPPTE